jgi:hypothetical protein
VQCVGGLLVAVLEQHGLEALPPFEIVGQHAQQHMPAHPICQPVIDRPDPKIDGFETAERSLDQGERLWHETA